MKNSPYGRESAFLSEILAVRAVLLLSGIHWNIQVMRFCILRFLRSGQQTVLTHQFIQKGGKTILYGNDTGMLYDEVFDYLKQQKICLTIKFFLTFIKNVVK